MTAFPFAVDPELDADALEAGRLLFARPCLFVKGVVALDGLPEPDRPEICFAGRSNVGKSSLINALTGQKGLARASNTPGRTQELNFFDLAEGTAWLVDLPGYGYAEAPKKKVAAWQRLLAAYMAGRTSLARVFVLIDARHGVKAADHETMDLLDRSAVSFQAVLTKCDKPRTGKLEPVVEEVKTALARHGAVFPEIRLTSAETGAGIPGLRATIQQLLAERA